MTESGGMAKWTQRSVESMKSSNALVELAERLSGKYGAQDGWWTADSAFEVAVGAVSFASRKR